MRIVFVGALALAAFWLIVRNAAIGLTAQSAPQIALQFPPSSGIAISNAILANPNRIPPEELKSQLRRALARSPLSDAPFAAAAAQARARGDAASASRYLAVAAERNRPRPTRRVLLLAVYVQQGRWAEAVDQAQLLSRNRKAMPLMTKALLMLAEHPEAKRALLQKLKEDPRWRRAFTLEARRQKAPKELLAELKALKR